MDGTSATGGVPSWAIRHEERDEEAARAQEEAEERLAERVEQLESENERLRDQLWRAQSQADTYARHGADDVRRLKRRMDAARKLVHGALLAAESGGVSMPWAALDSALTEALTELGCAGCGEKIGQMEMQLLVHVRRTCCHATGDCVDNAGRGEAKAIALQDVRRQLIGGAL